MDNNTPIWGLCVRHSDNEPVFIEYFNDEQLAWGRLWAYAESALDVVTEWDGITPMDLDLLLETLRQLEHTYDIWPSTIGALILSEGARHAVPTEREFAALRNSNGGSPGYSEASGVWN